jgi:heptosyltransferase-3
MKFALLSINTLGDSLYWGVIAHNLVRLGHEVSLFSNSLYQLSSQIDTYEIKPYPRHFSKCDLSRFDHILSHPVTTHLIKETGRETVETTLVNDKVWNVPNLTSAHPFAAMHGTAFNLAFGASTIMENIEYFFVKYFNDKAFKISCGFNKPDDWNHDKNKEKIIIHPFASTDRRAWPLRSWKKLTDRLQHKGYDVLWTVSTRERKRVPASWRNKINMPDMSIMNLAEQCSESQFFVGSSSGPIVLASMMKARTLTLEFEAKHGDSWGWLPCFNPNADYLTAPRCWYLPQWIQHSSRMGFLYRGQLSVEDVFSKIEQMMNMQHQTL